MFLQHASLCPLLVLAAVLLAPLLPRSARSWAWLLLAGVLGITLGTVAAAPPSRAEVMISRYRALDRLLVDKGFPPTSPWWMAQVERFYGSGRRQLSLRVGRRGGKSTTLCRLAVLEALWGEHRVPLGDVGIVGIVSVSRDEAAQRLRTVRSILDAIGAEYRDRAETVELTARPITFKVFSASISGVVGGTWVCALLDEVARWRDDAISGANPAREVLTSIRPCLATMPSAKLFMSSSPLGTEDAHAAAFAEGNNAFQAVAHAPSWIANPTLSEEATRELERDERKWSREYAAIPQAGAVGAFDFVSVNRAFRGPGALVPIGRTIMLTDSSQLTRGGDDWCWGTATWCMTSVIEEERWLWHPVLDAYGNVDTPYGTPQRDEEGGRIPNPRFKEPQRLLVIDRMGSLNGRFAVDVSADDVLAGHAALAKEAGADTVFGDQYMAYLLTAGLARHRIAYHPMLWSAETKAAAVARVRQWFREGTIVIEPGEEADALRRELLNFQERILPSGIIGYGARRGGHDDRVALLLNAAMADTQGLLAGSPLRKRRDRIDW
jgi:hypothetical protein